MSGQRLHNPGRFEQVYDSEGHILAGGESVTVKKPDAYTDLLIERGVLLSAPSEPALIRRKKPEPTTADGETKGTNS